MCVKANDDTIKQAIIDAGAIIAPAYGETVLASDISYTIDEYDNINGTLTLIVTINNGKYWKDGVVSNEEIMPAVVFGGFNQTLQTTPAADKNITDAAAFGSKQATNVQVDTTFIKNYIFDHLDRFIENKVPGTSIDNLLNVTISKYNTAAGTISFFWFRYLYK